MLSSEKIGELLKSFIFFDAMFMTFFCLGGLIVYEKDVFIIIFIIIALISYYPLYLYVKEYLSSSTLKEKTWHFRHMNTCFIYSASRIFLFFAYLAIAIIDMSAVDVPHAVIHLPLFSKIVLFILFGCIIMLIALAFRIIPYHNNYAFNSINNVVMNVSITKSHDPRYLENLRYTSLSPLMLHEANAVYLAPNIRSDDHVLRVTEFSNNSLQFDDR